MLPAFQVYSQPVFWVIEHNFAKSALGQRYVASRWSLRVVMRTLYVVFT